MACSNMQPVQGHAHVHPLTRESLAHARARGPDPRRGRAAPCHVPLPSPSHAPLPSPSHTPLQIRDEAELLLRFHKPALSSEVVVGGTKVHKDAAALRSRPPALLVATPAG